MIYFTSDLHFCHDRKFIYEPRGFTCIDDMNEDIVENWNNTVRSIDTVYLLGDIMLNDNKTGIELLKSLNGDIRIILGNHDTSSRISLYAKCKNIKSILYADVLNYGKYHFYLSHYPTLTGNIERESITQGTLNLFGHTHQKDNFYMDNPFMYHVGVDSHGCKPVSIDTVISDMKKKYKE